MRHLGMPEVRSVRIGKYMEINLDGEEVDLENRLGSRGCPCVPCGERLPCRTARSRSCSFEMKLSVIQFPGFNWNQDCVAGITSIEGLQADYVWLNETSLRDYDAIVLPGGFAYGD